MLDLKAFLGALDVLDQVVFAVPFDPDNQVLANGAASLVKTRLQLDINLLGLNVQNLFLFENTKFKHPFVDEVQALDATQTPSFRFGNLVSFSGLTRTGRRSYAWCWACAPTRHGPTRSKNACSSPACVTQIRCNSAWLR